MVGHFPLPRFIILNYSIMYVFVAAGVESPLGGEARRGCLRARARAESLLLTWLARAIFFNISLVVRGSGGEVRIHCVRLLVFIHLVCVGWMMRDY